MLLDTGGGGAAGGPASAGPTPNLFPRMPIGGGAPDGGAASSSGALRFSPQGAGAAPPRADEYPLRGAQDGSGDLIYDGSSFAARVGPDGLVSFRDKRVTSLWPFSMLAPVAAPRNVPSAQATAVGLARQGKAPPADDRAQNDTSYLLIPPPSPIRPDSREGCRTCSFDDPLPGLVSWKFDVTDEVARLSRQDPNRYAKARFLVATRDLRSRLGAESHLESIRRAKDELPKILEGIAGDQRRSPRERRAVLERLRDELDGDSPEARAAAHTVTVFLANRLPVRAGTSASSPRAPRDAGPEPR
jgi:hypothetical protein